MSSPTNIDYNGMILAWCMVGIVVVVLAGLAAAALLKWVKVWKLGR